MFESEAARVALDVPGDYMLNHMVCDFAETVRWWMNNDGYSAEEIAGFFLKTVPFCEN